MDEYDYSGFDQVVPGEDGRQKCLLAYTTEGEGWTSMLAYRRDGLGEPAAFSARVCARLKGTVLQSREGPAGQVMIRADRSSTLIARSKPDQPTVSEILDNDFAVFIGAGGRYTRWTYEIPLEPERVNVPGPISLYMTDLPQDTVVKAWAEFDVELGVEVEDGSMDVASRSV